MTAERSAARGAVRVHPRRALLRTGVLSAALAVGTLSLATVAIAATGGHWRILLGVDLAVAALSIAAGVRALMVFTAVDASGLRGNGMLSPVLRVSFDEIAAVHLVPTWTHSGEIVTQLLVAGHDGRRVFRRRGSYWDADALEAIAGALGVPTVHREQPMSIRAFWRNYPASAYWFEDTPAVRALVGVGVILIGTGLAVGVLAAMP